MSKNADIKFTAATVDDLDTLVRLETDLFPQSDRFSRRRFGYLIRSENAKVLLGWQHRQCVGYGIALKQKLRNRGLKGRVYSIGTLRNRRGEGIGSKILQALEKWIIGQGATYITLETRFGKNVHFYESRGYKSEGRLPRYYGTAAGLRMRKEVSTFRDAPS